MSHETGNEGNEAENHKCEQGNTCQSKAETGDREIGPVWTERLLLLDGLHS